MQRPSFISNTLALSAIAAGFALVGQGYASASTFSAQPDKGAKTVHAGIICSNGTICLGTGYAVSHPSTGVYDVTYPTGSFKTCPVITATAAGWTGSPPILNDFGGSCTQGGLSIEFRAYSSDGKFTPEDVAIEFIAQSAT